MQEGLSALMIATDHKNVGVVEHLSRNKDIDINFQQKVMLFVCMHACMQSYNGMIYDRELVSLLSSLLPRMVMSKFLRSSFVAVQSKKLVWLDSQ